MKQIVTNSSLTTFKVCPKRYLYQYEKRIRPIEESEALWFGSVFHEVLDEYYRNGRDVNSVMAILQNKYKDKDMMVLIKVGCLLKGYHDRYKTEPYEIIQTEIPFRAPVINPETAAMSKVWEYQGKIDALLNNSIIKETKTTSEDIGPESDYWRKLGLDSQLSGYFLGAEANGNKIETCLYDVIRKPTIRQKQTESVEEYRDRLTKDIKERPDFYYARREVPRSTSDLEDFLFDTWHLTQMLRACQTKKRFPRHTNSCVSFYGQCPYFKACSGQVSIDDPFFYKQDESAHPELSEGRKQNEVKK